MKLLDLCCLLAKPECGSGYRLWFRICNFAHNSNFHAAEVIFIMLFYYRRISSFASLLIITKACSGKLRMMVSFVCVPGAWVGVGRRVALLLYSFLVEAMQAQLPRDSTVLRFKMLMLNSYLRKIDLANQATHLKLTIPCLIIGGAFKCLTNDSYDGFNVFFFLA